MKSVLVVALLALSKALGYQLGVVQDTPEVAHAKAEHFAAVAKAKELTAGAGHGLWGGALANTWAVPHYAPALKYHGPIALPPGYDKHGAPLPVLDTPEVAHAKAAHLAAVAKAGGHVYPAVYHTPILSRGHGAWNGLQHGQYAAGHIKYHGPIALPPGYDKHGAPLPVLDTPEVAAAKAKHFHLYAKTLHNLGPVGLGHQHQHHHS
uniref:Uncharacterized protein n=1 Tax=Rhodnius prolixus TaxID=13249 RepID=T1HH83_RHOPR